MEVLEQLYPNLKNQETVLKEIIGHSFANHRSKRSVIDGVGTLFKVLFGTLDMEDAKRYDDAINNLDKNEHELITLLKSQSQIVKTTIHNFNNTVTDLKKSENIFSKNLETLANYTKSTNNKILNIDMKQNIDEHLSFLTLVTSEVNNEISMVIDAILFAKNNNLHPIIITPEQYIYELKRTVSHIPIHTQYPLDLNMDNASDLLSLVNIISYYMNEKLVFIIKTPLTIQQTYDVYNLVPVPILNRNDTYVFILPTEKYFLISENKIHYTTMENINICKKLSNNNNYICEFDKPLYSVYAKDNCELTLFLGTKNQIPSSCDTRIGLIKSEQWYKLGKENSWLFVMPSKVISTISCKNEEPHDLELKSTGIIELQKNCKLYSPNIILHSSNLGMMSNHLSVLPDFDIVNDNCCNKLKNNTVEDKLNFIPFNKFSMNFNDLNIASHKIDKINDLLDEINNDNVFHKVKNNTYFIFI
ncbi:uncharacterized protein LOC111364307, partial [Spodoptera litura]|uniref:Uncharacterized protein LOC111364307 n=1 Tax=Spodoptera litura TaxID=69820 RepID=A0A9J7J2A9_SPOLT